MYATMVIVLAKSFLFACARKIILVQIIRTNIQMCMCTYLVSVIDKYTLTNTLFKNNTSQPNISGFY